MTEKELLYVEDALGHEQYFQTQCRDAAGRLQELANTVDHAQRLTDAGLGPGTPVAELLARSISDGEHNRLKAATLIPAKVVPAQRRQANMPIGQGDLFASLAA